MKLRTLLTTATTLTLLLSGMNANAAEFWRGTSVTKAMTDASQYNGCMIHLSSNIKNGCPGNGWVSLDCDAKFSNDGKNMYASALMAMALNKTVWVKVDNTKKINGYCTAVQLRVQ